MPPEESDEACGVSMRVCSGLTVPPGVRRAALLLSAYGGGATEELEVLDEPWVWQPSTNM